jgi:hypothetical protein
MVKVRDGGDVPVAVSQRGRLASVKVVKDVCDDRFHDFIWETAGHSAHSGCLWRRNSEQVIDVGFASTPNNPDPSQEVCLCSTNGAEVRTIYAC